MSDDDEFAKIKSIFQRISLLVNYNFIDFRVIRILFSNS